MTPRHLPAFATLATLVTLVGGVGAQTLVIPAAAANADLPNSTGWPFDYAGNMRILYVYDAQHFTAQNIQGPIYISNLRLRANGAAATWIGDTVNSLTVDVSTAPLDYTGISAVYDTNHGPDRLRVYNGSLQIPAGTSTAGVPGPYVIDIAFSTPFFYDPNNGDLTIDMISSGPSSAANTPSLDHSAVVGQALAKRVYSLSYAGTPNGLIWTGESAHAIEFTYAPATGAATASPFGAGCYDYASSIYQTFTGNFDLGGSPTNSLKFFPNQGGFTVVPGSNTFFTPTSADFLLSDESLTPSLALPFTFPIGATTTNAVKMSSNGFLWLVDTETAADLTPTAAELLSQSPRIAPLWMDLDPSTALTAGRVGSTHYDVDPATNHAVFTWLNIAEYGTANSANLNTFQIELEPTGAFEIRWQNIATSASRTILTGVSQGRGARDGGAVDLSVAVPFTTLADADALALDTPARPILGSTLQLVASAIPSQTSLGAFLFGFTKVDPGLSLASLGAPGCAQYVAIDASRIFFSTGSSHALPQGLPLAPAFAGLQLHVQAAVLAAGSNALGLLTSNGLTLTLDVN